MRVAAVILAAGASTRLGEPKQLAVLAGERLLDRAVRVARAAGCEPIVVVLGASAEAILAVCDLAAVEIVCNETWDEGMASSLRVGIAAIASRADAVVVMTCDQPAVSPEHLLQLIALGRQGPVASEYAQRRGVPACFPAASFAALLELRGDAGARDLLASAPAVPLPGGALDIDTAEALAEARQRYF